MPLSPLAGKPAPPETSSTSTRLRDAYANESPTWPIPASSSPSAPAATAARRGRHLHRGAHPRHHAGDLRVPRASKGITGPLFLGKDTHAVRAGAADGPGGAGGQRRRDVRPGRRRLHAHAGRSPTPSSTYNEGRSDRRWPTASSSRRRTTRRPTAASSTTRPTAARPTPTSPTSCRPAPTSCSRPATRGVKRVAYEQALKAPTTHAHDFVTPYVDDLRQRHRHGGDPRGRA